LQKGQGNREHQGKFFIISIHRQKQREVVTTFLAQLAVITFRGVLTVSFFILVNSSTYTKNHIFSKKEVIKMKKPLLNRPTDTKGVPMMTADDVAEFLNIHTYTVYRYCNPIFIKHPLPFRRIVARFWFVLTEIQNWAENNTRVN
jgi:hypothetical protein